MVRIHVELMYSSRADKTQSGSGTVFKDEGVTELRKDSLCPRQSTAKQRPISYLLRFALIPNALLTIKISALRAFLPVFAEFDALCLLGIVKNFAHIALVSIY
jgi:hypothetical protein